MQCVICTCILLDRMITCFFNDHTTSYSYVLNVAAREILPLVYIIGNCNAEANVDCIIMTTNWIWFHSKMLECYVIRRWITNINAKISSAIFGIIAYIFIIFVLHIISLNHLVRWGMEKSIQYFFLLNVCCSTADISIVFIVSIGKFCINSWSISME